MEGYNKKNSKGGTIMIIFNKTTEEWKALELYYRREWLCFAGGLILGLLI